MKCKIGHLCCNIGSGGTPSRKKVDYYNNGDIKWLKTKELEDKNIYDTEEYITREGLNNSSAKLFPINTVTMAMYGATVGKLGILKTECATNQACCNMVVDRDKADYRFLYYSLMKNRDDLINLANGAAQQNLNKGIIENFEIEYYPLKEQKAIADILSSLDEKIELNNQMNQTLEEMAQALFKRWFVDFEFPNEEGQPYKSSGGEMVESELGMIPKGWELSSVYDLGDYINGTSFKKNDYSEHGVPIIKIAELKQGITLGTRYFKGDKDKKYYLENGDILFSWSGNPDTSIDTFIWHRGDAILNQHIFKVVPNYKVNGSYIYSLLKYFKPMFAETARNKQTTGLGHVTVSDLKRIKTTLDKEICRKYHSICESIIEQIINNNLENNMLIKLRDTLLPKLMSGEIRVSDLN